MKKTLATIIKTTTGAAIVGGLLSLGYLKERNYEQLVQNTRQDYYERLLPLADLDSDGKYGVVEIKLLMERVPSLANFIKTDGVTDLPACRFGPNNAYNLGGVKYEVKRAIAKYRSEMNR